MLEHVFNFYHFLEKGSREFLSVSLVICLSLFLEELTIPRCGHLIVEFLNRVRRSVSIHGVAFALKKKKTSDTLKGKTGSSVLHPLVLLLARTVTAKQYDILLTNHLCPVMKRFSPDGSGVSQDDSAHIYRMV